MEYHNNPDEVKYWVVFKDSELKTWVMNRLKKGFKHVLIASLSPGEAFWLITDPSSGNMLPTICSSEVTLNGLFPDSTIVLASISLKSRIKSRFWHINCVEIVKKTLGISNCFVVTPFQLYKYLMKRSS